MRCCCRTVSCSRALTAAEDYVEAKDLAERKQIFCDQADAFVVLPGGLGTLEARASCC